MAGYYYDRREDETPGVVADAAFAALIQLFIPFPYNEATKTFKKSLYFFIDRELFAYTDVINLSFYKMNREELPIIHPSEAVIYRFAAAYFLHCMVNRKLSNCESDLHDLAGTYPDTYLMDELFKAANTCCHYHPMQEWLKGTNYIKKDGKYIRNSFLDVTEAMKERVYDVARSSRFILCDVSGHFEYSWTGVRHRGNGICIEININHPLEEYVSFVDMVEGMLGNWGSRIFDSFRKEIMDRYKEGLDKKEREKLAEKLAVRGYDLDISDISFTVSENFYWNMLGLKRKNKKFSQRFASDLELMLFTLSVGENRDTYEQLRKLRNKAYGTDTDSGKGDELEALKKHLLDFLNLGPDRYLRALERHKDLVKAGVSSGSLLAVHDKVTIPNIPRMVMISIALDRYATGLDNIRRLENSRTDELIAVFRKAFTDTEVIKLNLITKDELGILLEKDCTLGARMEDLKELLELMPEDLQSDVKKVTSEQDR